MKIDIKALMLGAAIPAISLISPEAGKEIADAKEAFADGHLSKEETELLIKDTLATAKALLPPAWGKVITDLEVNLAVDVPNIEKTFADIHELTK